MLDAIESRRWQPDAHCLAAGAEYLDRAIRCHAAAGLSDAQIAQRLAQCVLELAPNRDRYAAAHAVARHCALMDVPMPRIIATLAYLAAEVPAWPDAFEIAAIAQAAVTELA